MKLTLLNYDFESDNENVLLFDNREQQKEYFDNISDKTTIDNINFNAGNLVDTEVYARVDNALSLFQKLNYNYAIVTEDDDTKPLFYFIKQSMQDSAGQIKLLLHMDMFNTVMVDVDSKNVYMYARRATPSRWKQLSNPTQSAGAKFGFNNRLDSPLLEAEQQNFAKYIKAKTKLYIPIAKAAGDSFGRGSVDKWLFKNVLCWQYIYLSSNVEYVTSTPNNKFTEWTDKTGHLPSLFISGRSTEGGFVCVCVPVYKYSTGRIKLHFKCDQEDVYFEWTSTSTANFLNENNGFANVKAIKYSIVPPFSTEYKYYAQRAEIDEQGNLILTYYNDGLYTSFDGDNSIFFTTDHSGYSTVHDMFIVKWTQDNAGYEMLPYYDNMTDEQIVKLPLYTTKRITSTKGVEPKIYNEQCTTYRIQYAGQTYDLPVLKTTDIPKFTYFETLTPDITKAVIQFSGEEKGASRVTPPIVQQVYSGIYDNAQNNFSGMQISIDLSTWVPQNNLDDYLAQNKNIAQIISNKQGAQVIGALAGTGSRMATGTMLGGATGGIVGATSGIFSMFGTAANLIAESMNQNLTFDNMDGAPNRYNNIQSNPLFIMNLQGTLLPELQLLQATEYELNVFKDYLHAYGYAYNRLTKLKNVIYNRVDFDYVQGDLIELPKNLGTQIKEELKRIFARGVRIWHGKRFKGVDMDTVNFEKEFENYENN